jgi:hypothetical protein
MDDATTSLNGYSIKVSDYSAFYRAYLRHNYWTLSRCLWTVGYAAFLFFVVFASKPNHAMDWADMIIMTVLAISVSYIVTPVLTYIHGVTQFAFGKAVKVQHNLSISGEGVTKSSPLATVSIPWTSLYAIDETRSTILFFTNRRCAIMLPKSAFASLESTVSFLSTARSYLAQAKPHAA